ncbi:HNH endonuclease family protein [Acinetobacter sp. ANC 4558]|uniref:HNH endonuclease family protein n=1 Tax=Acinetobacter sp. ANC 4558 TaxID=1977876 RepID=UPI001D176CD8|nr:HNH endonuclease family protein [Acinetobacter sp. ANC 4558]
MQKVQNELTRIEFLKTIERFSFLINITDRYVIKNYSKFRTIQSLVLKLCNDFKNEDIEAAQLTLNLNEISSKIKSESLLPILKQTLKNHNFYEWDMIRHFLFEYNLSLQHKSKTERSKINWSEFTENFEKDFITIEHIYPQNTRSAEWAIFKDFHAKEKKILRNSLGNLLPLSQPKNSSLSNKPFKDKINGKEGSFIGYRFGCYAENEVSKFSIWTPDNILDRGITLLNFLEKRWGVKLGTEEDKISLLGLNFLSGKNKV